MATMRIGVLEEDAACAELIRLTLESDGYVCDVFADVNALVRELASTGFHLLLLNWDAPGSTGDGVVSLIRDSVHPPPPMIFLTIRPLEEDIVAILEAGADDYLIKPASALLLRARVGALLRRTYGKRMLDAEVFGSYRFVISSRQLYVCDKPVPVSCLEFTLALLFFRHIGQALSRSYLREMVWQRDLSRNSRSLDTHVSAIRSKLNLRPANGYRISPIYRYGYRLEMVDGVEQG
ncbi:response regulator transcription factor [Paraburkholderia sp. BR14263]|uniref:response regulator transcription factor n=1 Tax=unclassified Paraburkholderia TaxID=2615204 RepID=UPI0034CE5B7D